jgi:hypothetical protein
MKRRAILFLLVAAAAALVAVSPARADGQVFIVTGTADGAGSCGPYPGFQGYFACTTLRGAVNAAGNNDVIGVPDGTYTLSLGELAITKSLSITGGNARDTVIQGSGSARVLNIASGTQVGIYGVTLAGGRAATQDGGNILNDGSLGLFASRLTNGQAANGAGIASTGSLTITSSLIDHNVASEQGGAIDSDSADVAVGDSTIFENQAGLGGGISAIGDGETISLSHVTMAFNTSGGGAGGITVDGVVWAAYGSLFIGNEGDGVDGSNCESPAANGQFSIEDGSNCGFQLNDVTPAQVGLATTLSDQGGPTPVLTIPGQNSLAKDFANPCQSGLDQRMAPRDAAGACDVGAFEQGASAPPVTGFQIPVPPTPTPPAPVPTPTPTPTPTATPVAGKSVAGTVVEGKVLVKTRGGKFVALDPTKPIPNGSTIDTKHGTIEITAQQKPGAPLQKAKFFDGIFKITQTKKTTDLTLNEALAKCPKKRSAHAAAKKKKPKTRKLWGNGSGSFRTRGQYSAATVRGTEWLVQDSCAGTLTRVKKGVVSVRDNVKRKTIVLRKGKKYLAKPRR